MSKNKQNIFKKGDVIQLKINCLGNLKGTSGVVYEEYKIGNEFGISCIFPNSNYDGFSVDEQRDFFEESIVKHDENIASYYFTNVMRLSEDFNNGRFKSAFIK